MSHFTQELAKHNPHQSFRRWLYVPYDQLSDLIGLLNKENPRDLGIIMIENPWKAARRPYHKQKLAFILSNMRHFALEQAQRGVAVKYVVESGPYRRALEPLSKELGPIWIMEPAERELRKDLEPLIVSGRVELITHEGWLTTQSQFDAVEKPGPRWRMDAFYRRVRRDTGVLMEKGKPVGGKFSFDAANRKSWRGKPPAPTPPTFPSDPIKEEVGALIEKSFSHHPGRLDLQSLPCTLEDAEALWEWAKDACLHSFGPYEDAMSILTSGMFHTRISSLLNIHRLLPSRTISEVLLMDLPLSSQEGFIRQILGWREFVRHVHAATDGFRRGIYSNLNEPNLPGDGGYARWAGKAWRLIESECDPSGGAAPNELGCETPLPPTFWGVESGLNCLDHVVASVWEEGYSHHITRLMILSNIATLLDVNPRELTDWFWIAYTDAFDWVVEPNVLGMGTYALGDLMTTKPYVSGAAYINRMSDFCSVCRFDPKGDCPITHLYWAFLDRHRNKLINNSRIAMHIKGINRRDKQLVKHDKHIFELVRERLAQAQQIFPEDIKPK